jgi:hypothetical protein
MPSATPAITEPLVELAVVDRPGVPAELYDRYWVTEVGWPGLDGVSAYEAGQVGTTARILLPPAELALGADDGRVASVLLDRDSGGVAVGPAGATFLVRDIRTGALLRKLESPAIPAFVPHGSLVVGPQLIWTGKEPGGGVAAGVWALNLDDPGSVPEVLIAEGADLKGYGDGALRAALKVSASGQTLGSLVVGPERGRTDVLDLASRTFRMTLDDIAHAVGDDTAVVRRPGGVALVDLETGKDIGALSTDTVYQALVADRVGYVDYARDLTHYISAIDPASGENRDLLVQSGGREWLYLSRDLSSGSSLTLLAAHTIGSAFDAMGLAGRATATLLDPATGGLRQDVFTVGAP